ncbi:MAG: radical SAM protein, partial [Eubacterium sp.]|nr:radical SAM protein [Eubacterium sp.]
MIHQYKNNGYNIVLDVNSASVHVVDDVVYDVLKLMNEDDDDRYREEELIRISEALIPKYPDEKLDIDEFRDIFNDIRTLEEEGNLFTKDVYREGTIDFKKRETVVKALCLHIAHACNLKCEYCFAGEGEYHGDRALMSMEVGKKALDFLVENSGQRKNLEVDFFGGEPLLNFDVVKELVKYGRSLEKEHDKHFRFTLTTNGVLLDDEIMEFAGKEMDNIVLSVDGRKEIHDRMRPFRDGTGSYDRIIDKFKKVA